MLNLFDASGLMPHGYCLMWDPGLVALHAGADAIIFVSYFIIPLAIVRFLRARPDVRFGLLGVLFASFILLCGLTHLFGILTLWQPAYEIEGFVKLLTGIVSATTAVVLFPLVPKLVALPSPQALETANARLTAEVERHKATLAELERARSRLEQQVDERTRELREANERLTIVTRETAHRAKNLLTIVLSIARQSATFAKDKDALVETLSGRMISMSRALTAVIQHGAGGAELRDVVDSQLAPYRESFPGRIEIDGPPLVVRAEAAQQYGLAVHELATNAMKHGALAAETGRVRVAWRRIQDEAGDRVELDWREEGAPAGRERSAGGGFGSRLLERAAPLQLRGEASFEVAANGYRYTLTAPYEALAPRALGDDDDDDANLLSAFA